MDMPVLFKDTFSCPSFGILALTLDIPRVFFITQGANDLSRGRAFYQWARPENPIPTGIICFQELESRFKKKFNAICRNCKDDPASPLLRAAFASIRKRENISDTVSKFLDDNAGMKVVFVEGLHLVRHGESLAEIWNALRLLAEDRDVSIICDYQSNGYYDYNVDDPRTCLRNPLSHKGIFHADDLPYASMADWVFGLLQVPPNMFKKIRNTDEEISMANDCLIGKFLSAEINIPRALHFYEMTQAQKFFLPRPPSDQKKKEPEKPAFPF